MVASGPSDLVFAAEDGDATLGIGIVQTKLLQRRIAEDRLHGLTTSGPALASKETDDVTSRLVSAVMAAVIAAGAGGVAFVATNGKGEDAREIKAALSAKVTAAQAITAAEQKTGGRAFEIGLEDENGNVLYEVKTITRYKVVEASIDPLTGQVMRTKDEGLSDRLN